MPKTTPCLWFDVQAEQAAHFYVDVFPNSRVLETTHFGSAGPRPDGMVMTVSFELDGSEFLALNGGPEFEFNHAVSFQISCADQSEVDYYWSTLGAGGVEDPCGWLRDKFGLSWQVVPTRLDELTTDPDPAVAQRAIEAMLGMGKIDIATLERAAAG